MHALLRVALATVSAADVQHAVRRQRQGGQCGGAVRDAGHRRRHWSAARRSMRMNFWRSRVPNWRTRRTSEGERMNLIESAAAGAAPAGRRWPSADSCCCSTARAPTWAPRSAAARRAACSAPRARPTSCRARRPILATVFFLTSIAPHVLRRRSTGVPQGVMEKRRDGASRRRPSRPTTPGVPDARGRAAPAGAAAPAPGPRRPTCRSKPATKRSAQVTVRHWAVPGGR